VESGLNDGLALPVVLLAVSVAGMMGEAGDAGYWIGFALRQIGLAPVVGVAIGYLGGQVVVEATRNGWMSKPFENVSALALAVLAFAGAEAIGGNGFISAFVCGLTLGNTAQGVCECLHEFGEAEGQLLTLLVFLLFGAVILPGVLVEPSPEHWIYVVASLSIVRMLPVALSLLGAGLMPSSLGFLGWFGPRGLASILYMLIVVEHGHLPAGPEIDSIVALTVLTSVFLHGLTAHPLAARYGARVAASRRIDMPEAHRAMELPVRVRFFSGAESRDTVHDDSGPR
jgi:NhaP-type Na+/H+ or K+/H+ antiporter